MAWKPEYEENRKRREEENPELREKRLKSAKDSQDRNREFRKGYLHEYYKKHPEKYKRVTQEEIDRRNELRRQQYANDAAHREKLKAKSKEWQAANPRKRLNQRVRKYGLTVEGYEALLESQGGVCAICGGDDPVDKRSKRFHVDHCHDSLKVRGLLCMNCNMGLGKFKDNIGFLTKAIEYLTINGGIKCP